MTRSDFVLLKIGSWFKLDNLIFKIFDIVGDYVFAHRMSFENDEYIEVAEWTFHRSHILASAEIYKPYEEESEDKE